MFAGFPVYGNDKYFIVNIKRQLQILLVTAKAQCMVY